MTHVLTVAGIVITCGVLALVTVWNHARTKAEEIRQLCLVILLNLIIYGTMIVSHYNWPPE